MGREILAADDYAAVKAMGDAVLTHPAAAKLLGAMTDWELSGLWDCRQTGERSKCRCDAVGDYDGIPICLDLKTTRDASPKAFERAVWNYHYHTQAAHYVEGLAVLGRPVESFGIVAVEKEPPYAVGVYRILDDVLAVAREEVFRLLALHRECRESGRWPAYSDEVRDIGLPKWAWRELEEAD
jgi:exodeoxyribonuclease VIII